MTCTCGKRFEPLTTRYSKQTVNCPKCYAAFACDYNAEPPTVRAVVPT